MDKNNIIREKTFNKSEYDKKYRRANYKQVQANCTAEQKELISNYCNDNGISVNKFIITAALDYIDKHTNFGE